MQQYNAMQQRIAVLTAELKKYKYRYEQDNNVMNKNESRQHRRHDKGKKHSF